MIMVGDPFGTQNPFIYIYIYIYIEKKIGSSIASKSAFTKLMMYEGKDSFQIKNGREKFCGILVYNNCCCI